MNKVEVSFSGKLDENTYKTVLSNGLEVYICKKSGFKKKIGMFGTKYGSVINDFVDIQTRNRLKVPDGIAHFLEHKLFEQEGANALDLFSKIGVSSNAYTTFDHTVYYFETIDKFNEGLELLIKLVKTPYFTDENVEKEKGIIAQEIKMYDDHPFWQVYMNAMKCLYKNNPVKLDIAGTVESISEIDKETLYYCYNTFYTPANMLMVVSGDFVPEELIEQIQSRLIKKDNVDVERIYPQEPEEINEKEKIVEMAVNNPLFVIGFKDKVEKNKEEMVRKHIAIEILLYMLIGKSSSLYQDLYKNNLILAQPDLDYEFSKEYAHITISRSIK